MIEDNINSGPEKCNNCGSSNIVGPFKVYRGTLHFGPFRVVHHQAFVCQDCYHSMLFIRKEHKEMFDREMRKAQRQYL